VGGRAWRPAAASWCCLLRFLLRRRFGRGRLRLGGLGAASLTGQEFKPLRQLTNLRHVLLNTAPSGDLLGDSGKSLGLGRIRVRLRHRNTGVAALAGRLVERDLAQELET